MKFFGLVLVVVGGILLYFGYQAANSPVEEISQTLTGRYSRETMIYLIGGAASGVLGLILILRGK